MQFIQKRVNEATQQAADLVQDDNIQAVESPDASAGKTADSGTGIARP